MKRERIVVTGAGGFIGHHLVKRLKGDGHFVRGVDLKEPEFEPSAADEFEILDLRLKEPCLNALRGMGKVYALAADMGGIGFIESHKAEIMRNSALINLHTIDAAREHGARRFLFTSSACIYPGYRQKSVEVVPLKEEDAYPADAEDGYGWEKLFMERQCRHYREDFGLDTRVVRFHNIYGPLGTWDGGREKSPAALCRKVAGTPDGGEIEIWGDGKQTRSYCYVDDCVEGLVRLMESSFQDPLNLGTDRLVSVNDLADLVCRIGGKRLRRRHDESKPQGVRGRNSDNTLLRKVLGWEPRTTLEDGMAVTYRWIAEQVRLRDAAGRGA
jgi:nucleoside-diphosphate-sugar epimerase